MAIVDGWEVIRRRLFEDASGAVWCEEVRRHVPTGERQKLTYPLDAPIEGD